MPQIFICYSRLDEKLADDLSSAVERAGNSVFIDRRGIRTGDQWRAEIVKAISSADIFLVLLSGNSLQSDEVRRELDLAVELKIPILPLEFEPVVIPDEFKYQLAGLQRHDLYTDFEAGVAALLELPVFAAGGRRAAAQPTGADEGTGKGVFIGRMLIWLAMMAAALVIFYSALKPEGEGKLHRSPFAVYLMLCGAIYALFNITESLLKKNLLQDIARWIMDSRPNTAGTAWAASFIMLFDSVFAVKRTVRGFKIPSFIRSSIASLIFALLLWGIMKFNGIELVVDQMKMFPDSWAADGTWGAVLEALVFTLALSIFFNVLPDFLSLIETRYILKKIQSAAGLRYIVALLLIDIIFTLMIAFIGSMVADGLFPLVNFMLEGLVRGQFDTATLAEWWIPYNIGDLFQAYGTVLMILDPADAGGVKSNQAYYCAVFIYSTFLTSLWIWLYALSGLVVRAGIKVKSLNKFISATFRVNERPLSVLGGICISIVSIVFWGVQLVSG
jgi:hypothetical protein